MGCLKLTYWNEVKKPSYRNYTTESPLKVVYRADEVEQKDVQRFLSLDPLMSMFPHMSPYVGFANNPIFFVDPYGLAPTNENGFGEGDPGGETGGEAGGVPEWAKDGAVTQFPDFTVTAERSSKSTTDQQRDRATMQGDFGKGGEFEGDYGSADWFDFMDRTFGNPDGFQLLESMKRKMTTGQYLFIYNNFARKGDGNNYVMSKEEQDELRDIWGKDYDEFISQVETLTLYLVLGAEMMTTMGPAPMYMRSMLTVSARRVAVRHVSIEMAKKATTAKTGVNVVYVSVERGVTQYVGITNNFARRAAQHLGKKGINVEPLMQGLTRSDARAVEQALIEIHGLGKNGGTLLNKINSISRTNPAYGSQLQRGYELLKSIGYN